MSLVKKPSPAVLIAFVALLVALGGTSVAAPVRDAASKLISGKQIKNNSITGADVKNRSLTAGDFKGALPRGPQGERGPQGASGQNGRNGENAIRLWARVSESGALVGGSGATAARQQNSGGSPGQYEVDFNRNVDGCGWIATHESTLSSPSPGGIAVSGAVTVSDPKNRLYVGTRNAAGALTNAPFTLAVVC